MDKITATGASTAAIYLDGSPKVTELLGLVRGRIARDAAKRLRDEPSPIVADVLERLHAPHALGILDHFDDERRAKVHEEIAFEKREQWAINEGFPAETIGRCMERPIGVFSAETSVADAVEGLREQVKTQLITYVYITDGEHRLLGLVVMREMLLASRERTLGEIMLTEPFAFRPDETVSDAMKEAVRRHFPVYPVCDREGRLVGLVRGVDLFEQNMTQIVVQAGSMVGVEKEERITTSWQRSLRMRHPWLQLNLVTAFVAGGVVGLFQETIDRAVVLAAFLPILAGQSGNTGCQALAVTLRGMTLGDLAERKPISIVFKEAMLGLLNGGIVGIFAGGAMYFYAQSSDNPDALLLGSVVLLAMIGSCVVSGVSGSLVPIILKKCGADPATASSIFLTTATDVVSMGLLLGLASLLVL